MTLDFNLSSFITPSFKQMQELAKQIKTWGISLGFQQVGITDVDLSSYHGDFQEWLAKQFHGEMEYMSRHGDKRTHPDQLVPGTTRIISVRMDYLPPAFDALRTLKNNNKAYISRYALGRDYHRLIRKRLKALAEKIESAVPNTEYRVFCDSAPVLEKPIAEKAGLGWIGKNTLLLNSKAGSWFFLGEIFTNIPLPIDEPLGKKHCGSCTACIDVCPTNAIVAPYQLDARRCISYLTIELRTSIPIEFRKAMGNRIYGCDDCQLFCPWNKFAKLTGEADFHPRHTLDACDLVELFAWTEDEFFKKTEGSPIRRIGYECWLRNLAVALGNAKSTDEVISALKARADHPSAMVREHVMWALGEHEGH